MPVDITPIGLAFLLAIGLSLIVQPRTLIWVLSAAIPFSHASMITVGDNGLSPFWVGAIAATGRLVFLMVLRARRSSALDRVLPRLRGATSALFAFGGYGAIITLVGPLLFRGVPVISPRGGLDSQIDNFTPLSHSISNLAQLCYLVIGIGLVLYLIAEPPASFRSLEAAILIGFALTLFKHFLPDFWPQTWFDSNPSYTYHWLSPTARERGPFAEPSLLGMFVSMSLAYSAAAFFRASWKLRIYYGALVTIGLYVLGISYTGTALISVGLVAGAALIVVVVILIKRSSPRTRWIAAGTAVVVLLLMVSFHSVVKRFTIDLVIEKLGSESFANRSASNENSLRVFLDSFAMGVGLGSDRPSSLFFLLLSCAGVLGTLFYLRALTGYVVVGFRSTATQAVAWAFLTQMVAQFIAKPDLSMPAMWFLIAMLATGYNAWALRENDANPAGLWQATASLVTWIPREFRLRAIDVSSDALHTGSHAATPRLRRRARHERDNARTRWRRRLFGVAAISAIVIFFGAAGVDGYVAQHEASVAVQRAQAKVGVKVQQYAAVWASIDKLRKGSVEPLKAFLSVPNWTSSGDFEDPLIFEEYTATINAYQWTLSNPPKGLPTASDVEDLASYTPPSAGMDIRSTKVAVGTFAKRRTEAAQALARLKAYRSDIEARRDTALDAFVTLSEALISSARRIDTTDAPRDESEGFSVALAALADLPADARVRDRYEAYMSVISTRNTLLRAVEAERLERVEQERLEQDRLEQERLERQRLERERREQEAETPPAVQPEPAPTAPVPDPPPVPEPEPTPTETPSGDTPGADASNAGDPIDPAP